MKETKRINLTLPKHWNQCTTEQLELISQVMQEQLLRQDRYHTFSMYNVKLAMFFALSGIQIVASPNPREATEAQYYTCRFLKDGKRADTFPLYLWQINYWLSPKAKTDDKESAEYLAQGAGMLDWLDNERGMFLTKFPYPTLKRRRSWWRMRKTFQGAFPDLDGFSWAQYRFASDTMGTYTQLSNSLVQMQQMGTFTPTVGTTSAKCRFGSSHVPRHHFQCQDKIHRHQHGHGETRLPLRKQPMHHACSLLSQLPRPSVAGHTLLVDGCDAHPKQAFSACIQGAEGRQPPTQYPTRNIHRNHCHHAKVCGTYRGSSKPSVILPCARTP